MTNATRRLRAIATGQRGSFSRAHAHALGISDRQLRSRVQSGILQQTGPHAFVFGGSKPSHLVQLTTLLHDVGDPCVVSGSTAAAMHAFDGFVLRRPFHVTVPRSRNVRRIGAVVHTAFELDAADVVTVDGLRCTSPCRTIIDLARTSEPEELARALDSALRDRLVSEDFMHRRIAALRGHGRYGIPALLDVLGGREVTRGGHSWLEREFLRLVHAAGLPRPLTQQVLTRAGDRLVRVDCRFPGTSVVVELLGYRFHRTKEQMRRDAERANALMLDGFTPYQFTYDQVVTDPGAVLDTVERALRRSA